LITGGAWQVSTLEMTDPRFEGEVVVYANWCDVNPGTAESMDICDPPTYSCGELTAHGRRPSLGDRLLDSGRQAPALMDTGITPSGTRNRPIPPRRRVGPNSRTG
jgi:hypothetical protein